MKFKQALVLGSLALATGAVLAREAPISRSEAVQSVFATGAADALEPAGESPGPSFAGSPSTMPRAAVKSEVLLARADGGLIPAGSGSYASRAYRRMVAVPSSLTRKQVDEKVLEASAEGALIPAGEAAFGGSAESTVHVASNAASGHKVLASRTVE